MPGRLLYGRHVKFVRQHFELECLLEFLEPARVIAMPMREYAQSEIRVFTAHLDDGIHDDIGIGVGESGIDQDDSFVTADQERFYDAARAIDAAGNDFYAVNGFIFQDADHDLFLAW
jgi:hypothetical protein